MAQSKTQKKADKPDLQSQATLEPQQAAQDTEAPVIQQAAPEPPEKPETPPEPEVIATIPMVRDEPAHKGGPTTADVHPDEVEGMKAAGWREAD